MGDTATLVPTMHTDIARLRRGRVGAQFWALYLPSSIEGSGAAGALFEQINLTHRMIKRYSDVFEQATSAERQRREAEATSAEAAKPRR